MALYDDLWGEIGSLSDDEAGHVLARLFAAYDLEFENNPDSEVCKDFFKKLSTTLSQTKECNLNRR